VGSFPQGQSPYGVDDMAGNVWEWTADWYQPYPGSTYESKDFGQKFKVLRGSSWGGTGHYALPYFYRSAHRFYIGPEMGFADAGIRCAKSQ
jgi:formylglycine-generating enzyme required for sulfatase activity